MSLRTDNARECVDASGQSSGSSNVSTVMLAVDKPSALYRAIVTSFPSAEVLY